MSKLKRTTILEGMFYDICTEGDRKTVDELYRQNNKGSATVLMLKRVREVWVRMINSRDKVQSTLRKSAQKDTISIPRLCFSQE